MPSVPRWRCYEKHPAPQFSLRAGPIFADSRVSLDKWLVALWMIVNCKNGISSYEIPGVGHHAEVGMVPQPPYQDGAPRWIVRADARWRSRGRRDVHRGQGSEHALQQESPPDHRSWPEGQDDRAGDPGAWLDRPHEGRGEPSEATPPTRGQGDRGGRLGALQRRPRQATRVCSVTTPTAPSTMRSSTWTDGSTPTRWSPSGHCSSAASTASGSALSPSICSAIWTSRRTGGTTATGTTVTASSGRSEGSSGSGSRTTSYVARPCGARSLASLRDGNAGRLTQIAKMIYYT